MLPKTLKTANLICALFLSQLGSVYCWQRKSASSLKIYFRQRTGSLLTSIGSRMLILVSPTYMNPKMIGTKAMQYTLKAILLRRVV